MTKPPKARHIDFYPDEYLAGISGRLSPEQLGVYWTICSLIYSKSAPIDDDPKWLGNVMGGTHWRTIKSILDALKSMGKIVAKDGQLWVQRCDKELAKTNERISKAQANGKLGGRPPKENNNLDKADGFHNEKLTTNHQPPTNNPQPNQKKPDIENGFEDFWKAYPRKIGKGNAELKYKSALKTSTSKQILEGLARYIATNPDPKYTKHPATWLNGKCWLDEYETAPVMLSTRAQRELEEESKRRVEARNTRKIAEKGL